MATVAAQNPANPSNLGNSTNTHPNLQRSRTRDADEFSPVHFTHNLSVKLNDHNFLLWKQQVLVAIRGNRLLKFIQDEAPPPQFLSDADRASSTYNPEFLDWDVQDQLLVSWLLSSMTESLLTRMVGCHTARQIWANLEKHFTLKVSSKILEFKTKLQNLKKGTLSLNDYLLKVKQHVDLLASVGEVLSDRDHIAAIFKGLPSNYDTFVISTNTRIEGYSVGEIEALLLASESRIEKTEHEPEIVANLATSEPEQQPEVNLAYQNRFSRANYPSRPPLQFGTFSPQYSAARGSPSSRGAFLYHPRANGYGAPQYNVPHLTQVHRGSFNRGGRSGNSSNRPQCQLCLKIGHTVVDCFYRFDKSFTGVQSNPSAPSPQANLAHTSGQNDTNWYPDSGATNHCTPDIHNLVSNSPYEGSEQLVVGDGTGFSQSIDDWDIPEWPVFL